MSTTTTNGEGALRKVRVMAGIEVVCTVLAAALALGGDALGLTAGQVWDHRGAACLVAAIFFAWHGAVITLSMPPERGDPVVRRTMWVAAIGYLWFAGMTMWAILHGNLDLAVRCLIPAAPISILPVLTARAIPSAKREPGRVAE